MIDNDPKIMLQELDDILKARIAKLANTKNGMIITGIRIAISKEPEYIGHNPDFEVQSVNYEIQTNPTYKAEEINNEKLS